jgi:phage gpG-like protein
MGWLTFSVDRTDSFRNVEAMLNELRGKMDDVSDPLKEIAAIYKSSTMKRFSTKTTPEGRPWKKLQKRTILAKTRGYGSRGPSIGPPSDQLVWTGKMRGAIKVLFQKREKRILIGVSLNEVPYARLHQSGSNSKFGDTNTHNVPARKWLGTTKGDNRAALAVMTKFFRQAQK